MTRHGEVYVIGAGGHAKVVIATLREGGYTIKAALDDDSRKWGSQILDVPILGPVNLIRNVSAPRAVIAIGENRRRKALAETYAQIEWLPVVHPTAYVHPTVRLAQGTVVFARAVIQPGTTIGSHCIINTAASVDHDCRLEDFVHIAPGVNLAGAVVLEQGVFVGIGSAILPGVKVGRWTVVGAGGVVDENLDEQLVAVGVPARPIRRKE